MPNKWIKCIYSEPMPNPELGVRLVVVWESWGETTREERTILGTIKRTGLKATTHTVTEHFDNPGPKLVAYYRRLMESQK